MAVWSKISTSALVGAIRLDAEFWQPAYLVKEKAIRAGDYINLGALVSKFRKGIFYILAKEYADQGVSFYRSSNVGGILPNDENLAFITKEKNADEAKTSLTAGDLMMVKTGKSGASVVFDESCNVSQDVIAVKARREKVDPYYLAVYLNTQYGKSEMDRWFQGQVQPHLSLDDARKIWVSMLTEKEQAAVAQLVVLAWESRNAAKSSYSQAQRLLETELGLDRLHFDKPVGYTAFLSKAMSGNRIDADYFQPRYGQLRQTIERYNNGVERLDQICVALKPNIDPSKIPAKTCNYVELSQINSGLGMIEGSVKATGGALPSRARRQVRTGDVLASAVVGSVDKVALVTSIEDGFIASTGFFQLRPRTISPEFLLLLVRSRCVSMQFQQQATGGILSAVPDSRLKYVIVPRVPQNLQDKLTELVAGAHQAKRKSDALLQQAKAHVEKLIEEAIAR